MAPTHASSTFLIKMFFVFLLRTDPAHNIAKPACMKNTKKVFVSIKLTSTSSLTAARARFASFSKTGGPLLVPTERLATSRRRDIA